MKINKYEGQYLPMHLSKNFDKLSNKFEQIMT